MKMTQVIYGDLFFLVNFSMDFLSLHITAKLFHRESPFWRLVTAAALGGAYALAALFLPPIWETVLTLLFPFPMVLVAFGYRGGGRLFKYALTLFAVSFALGGVMTAAYYGIGKLLTAKGILVNGEVETLYSDLPLPVLCLVALLSAMIARLSLRFCKKQSEVGVCEVRLFEGERTVEFSALLDSGNFLSDPVTHLPVVVVTRGVVEALVTGGLLSAVLSEEPVFDSLSPAELRRFRLIPVTTVGGGSLLKGFLPEGAEIGGERKKVCVAFDPTGDFGECEGILSPSLL